MHEKFFKGYHDSKRLLNIDKYFELSDRKTVNGKITVPFKRSFASGVTIEQNEIIFCLKEIKFKQNKTVSTR